MSPAHEKETPMETAFPFEVNVDGEHHPAQLIDSHDHNNASFAVLNTNDGTWSVTPTIPRGDAAGHFRDRS
jgi:hypothetical protein